MKFEDFIDIVKDIAGEYDHSSVVQAYGKMMKSGQYEDIYRVKKFIMDHLPADNLIALQSILMTYGEVSATVISQAKKWLEKASESTVETLCGPYITETAEEKLRLFLDKAIPVRREFDLFCKTYNLQVSPSIFRHFTDRYKKQCIQTRYHPFCYEDLYWINEKDALLKLFRLWYAEFYMEDLSERKGYLSIRQSAQALDIKIQKMWNWVCDHMDCVVVMEGRYLIAEDFIQSLVERWNEICDMEVIIRAELMPVPPIRRTQAKEYVLKWLKNSQPRWLIAEDSYPQQIAGKLYTQDFFEAKKKIGDIIDDFPAFPLTKLKAITGMKYSQILEKEKCGAIEAVNNGDEGVYAYFISMNERRRIQEINDYYMSLDDIVLQCCKKTITMFQYNKQYDREELLICCETNDWWGFECVSCDDMPIDGKKFGIAVKRCDVDQIEKHLSYWLQGYQQSYSVRFLQFADRIKQRFPLTARKLLKFETEKHPADKPLIELSELLLFSLTKELKDMSDSEIEDILVSKANNEATRVMCTLLSDFLLFGKYTTRKFVFSEAGFSIDTSAYPIKDFAVMVQYIVNDKVVAKADLVRKAIHNKRFARLWLYISIHVFAAWRNTDCVRMLPPTLPDLPKLILEKIEKGSLPDEETIRIAEYFIELNTLHLNQPNKTMGTPGVPNLYFCCPEDCRLLFGKILAIATAHFQLEGAEGGFVKQIKDWYTINQFFGSEFAAACGNRDFSGRRANKSLMQSIELVGREDNQLPPLVAYNLASIMRAHKLTYGGISDVTDIYLHDANFSGLTPEYVAYQMFNRGVCSFVVDAMLRICYGESYKALPEFQKTALIVNFGLSPAEASNVLDMVHEAQDNACEVVQSVCQNVETVEEALKAIALGHGTGKAPDVYCICKAAGERCRCPERMNCLGCSYEIRTKALLLRYAVVHHQLCIDSPEMSVTEKKKNLFLRKTITYPAMAEIVMHLQSSTSETELQFYQKLIEEEKQYGIANAGAS